MTKKKRDRRAYFEKYRAQNRELRRAQQKRRRDRMRAIGKNQHGQPLSLRALTINTISQHQRSYKSRFPQSGDLDYRKYCGATKCEICGAVFEPGRGNRMKSQDHCHRTGALRGVICHACNIAQGMLNDLETAIRMVEYFKRWNIVRNWDHHQRPSQELQEPTLFDLNPPPHPPLAGG